MPDVRPYVTRAALTIAPLEIARGTQNKILESMAMGVPVCAADRPRAAWTPCRARHLLAYDTHEQSIDAVLGILQSTERRTQLARAGRGRVLSHHSWPVLHAPRGCADCLSQKFATPQAAA